MESLPQWAKDGLAIRHEAFERIKGEFLPDIDCCVTYYKHKSGVTFVGIVANPTETESSFDIIFPTYSSSDGGHPHIIEHALLGGSKSYPSKRSFCRNFGTGYFSYLNATTYHDHTTYFFSSTNDVYFKKGSYYMLESVFRPRLVHDHGIFKQEAWHLVVEPEDDVKPDKAHEFLHHGRKFSFCGIVYDEMRMRLSYVTRQVENTILEKLYTNAHHHEANGYPTSVGGLSYDSLEAFYKKFYYPSRAIIYIYTSKSLYEKLEFFHQYFTNLPITLPDPNIPPLTPPQEYRDERVEVKLPYHPHGSVGDILVAAWLLDPVCNLTGKTFLNYTERIAWNVLEHVLMGNDKTFLFKALIPYGTNIYPGIYDITYRQSTLSLGVQGFNPKNLTSNKDDYIRVFNNLVEAALEEKVKNGFDQSELLAAINTVEFKRREVEYSHLPRSLQLTLSIHTRDIVSTDGIEVLKFYDVCKYLRSQVSTGYFEGLIRDKLLKNNHRLTIHAYPSEEFSNNSNKGFYEAIKSYAQNFTKDEVDKLEREHNEYMNHRDETELDPSEKSKIPRDVRLDDIPKPSPSQTKTMLLVDNKLQDYVLGNNGIPTLIQEVHSYGILYLDFAYSLRNLTLSELQALKVLTVSWRESVTDEFEHQIGIHLGGLNLLIDFVTPVNNAHSNNPLSPKYSNRNNSNGYLIIRVKFFAQNIRMAIELTKNFFSTRVNIDKHYQVIPRLENNLIRDFTKQGIVLSHIVMGSRNSVTGYAKEHINGYTFLNYLQTQAKQIKVDELNQILEKVINPENLMLSFAGSMAEKYFMDNLDLILQLVSFNGCTRVFDQDSLWAKEVKERDDNEYVSCAIPAGITNNFICIGGPLFNESDDMGPNLVISNWLYSNVFWYLFREKGGSYGNRTKVSSDGNLSITNYAAPNILYTCKMVYQLPQYIRNEVSRMTQDEFDLYKIGALSKLDAGVSPYNKALASMMGFASGKTPELNSQIRNGLLNATLDDLVKFADRFEKFKDQLGIVIIGNNDQILNQTEAICKVTNRKLKMLNLNN